MGLIVLKELGREIRRLPEKNSASWNKTWRL